MKRTLIFGAGSTGLLAYEDMKSSREIVGFLDNEKEKWGQSLSGVPILGNINILSELEYDEIIVASLTGGYAIRDELFNADVDPRKVSLEYVQTRVEARINFLKDYAKLVPDELKNCAVAEGGVFQGDFSKVINECFPDSQLFLFDTFSGFDTRDLNVEDEKGWLFDRAYHLSKTSVELVLSKLLHAEKAIVRKGYFPETAKGLEEEKFIFVNLDFDLYQPILEGLRFFYPRMVCGGVIVIHDFYSPGCPGVKKAIDDFETETKIKIRKMPIGDHCSIAIPI